MKFLTVVSDWIAFETDTPGLYVFVRLAPDERGELVVRDLLVSGAGRVTTGDLRDITLNQVEAGINARSMAVELAVERASASASAEFIDHLRAEAAKGGPQMGTPQVTKVLPRPDGTDPEWFYAEVAEVYRSHAAQTNRPAAAMAEASGVPVATTRRWIAEARRRGHLPPGQRGRAG